MIQTCPKAVIALPIPANFGRPAALPASFSYIANHGNAGDAVIGLAFEQLAERQDATLLSDATGASTYVIGGGGNLVPMYSHLAARIARLPLSARVLILPSSTYGRWDLLARFERIHLHCRERETFRQAELHGIPVTLDHDLAFHLDYSSFKDAGDVSTLETLHAFRGDSESARFQPQPPDNRDISLEWPQNVWDAGRSETIANAFISTINRYKRVSTDRLHVGIVATMLGKDVEFHGNSYFKNRAVFQHSLSNFPNCRWMGP